MVELDADLLSILVVSGTAGELAVEWFHHVCFRGQLKAPVASRHILFSYRSGGVEAQALLERVHRCRASCGSRGGARRGARGAPRNAAARRLRGRLAAQAGRVPAVVRHSAERLLICVCAWEILIKIKKEFLKVQVLEVCEASLL